MNKKRIVLFIQLFISLFIIILYEYLGRSDIINSFITSYPSKIVSTLIDLFVNYSLIHHIAVTLSEVLISFVICNIISFVISIFIYRFYMFDKIIDPFLTMANSLPKVALGPLIIIIMGSNQRSIILMAVLISIFTSIQSISMCFKNTNKEEIKVLKSFGSSEIDTILLCVIPSNIHNIISSFKISISLCLIGTIMGEFLTSKAGVGYLIIYGMQIFNMSLVMSNIIVLLLVSLLLYGFIRLIEKHLS